jgi:N-acetylmuramoyl-L-alanine amidase/FG-GAP-like repeat
MPLAAARHGARIAAILALSLAAGATSVALTGPLEGAASARQEPVASSRVTVETRLAQGATPEARRSTRSVSQTDAQTVHRGLAVVGATWTSGSLGERDVVQLRVRRDGAWSAWEEMDRDDHHGPDTVGPGSAESRQVRDGTAPYVVDGQGVQVRVLSESAAAPPVRVSVIDPGVGRGDDAVGAQVPGAASAAAPRPTILTRRDWGADESMRNGTPGYGQAHVAFVHHTAGTNSYSSAQVPGIIRGIYDYHVNGQGWSDIGYNFLVDRFGRTWEGRYGGVDKAVVGAHTLNHNSGSFGVAAIGDFRTIAPPSVLVAALERVIAWKLSVHGMPATGSALINGSSYARISGHRNAVSTTCPGERLYALLPSIRAGVASRIGTQQPTRIRRSADADGTNDLLAYPGSTSPAGLTGPPSLLRLAPTAPTREGVKVGQGWNALALATVSPDLTGDGRADLLAVDRRTTQLRLYAGNGAGGAASVVAGGAGWDRMRSLLGTGDRDGDGRADLVAVTKEGRAILYRGDGAGWFRPGVQVGAGWEALRTVTAVGDLSGDGRDDIAAIRTTDQALVLLATQADGSAAAAQVLSGGWGSVNLLVGGRDLDRDGAPGDLMGRETSGRMRTYYADARRALSRANVWGGGWQALQQVSSGADWSGDGVNDILAVSPTADNGRLVMYPGTGARDFSAAPLPTGLAVDGVDLARIVGDVDGDGHADAVLRRSDGVLLAARGLGTGRFGAPFAIGSGWHLATMVSAAGDYTRDGVPDLLVRMSSGEARLYSLDRSFRFTWQVYLETGWNAYVDAAGVGSMNADFNGDLVALRASDGALLLYRGSGPGSTTDFIVLRSGQRDLAQIVGMGDLNGDGPHDILARDTKGNLWLYTGNGGGGLSYGRQPVRAPRVIEVIG